MGLKIWLVQRLTALYLLCFGSWLVSTVIALPLYDYAHWKTLWSSHIVAACGIAAFMAIGIHAFLGLWFILSDYLKNALARWLILGAYASWFTAIISAFISILGGLA